MERKYKHTTNKLCLMSQSLNMDKNEPFIKVLTAPWVWMGGVNPHLQKNKTKTIQKTLQGYSKNQLRFLSTFPMGDVSGIGNIYVSGLYMVMQEAVKTKIMAIHTVHGAGAGDNMAYMGLAEEHHRLFIVSTDPGWVPLENNRPCLTKT